MPRAVDEKQSPFQRAVLGQVDYRALPTRREVMAARVRVIATALLDGMAPDLDLVEFIRERESDPASPFFVADGCKGLSYAMCRRLIVRANDLIAQSAAEDRERLIAQHIAKRRRLYAQAVQGGDVRAALAVLDSEANLLGLFPERSGLPGASGGVNLQVLVQAVIAAETKTLEAVTLEAVPVAIVESTTTKTAAALIDGGSNGDGAEETEGGGGGCRDKAALVGSEAL